MLAVSEIEGVEEADADSLCVVEPELVEEPDADAELDSESPPGSACCAWMQTTIRRARSPRMLRLRRSCPKRDAVRTATGKSKSMGI